MSISSGRVTISGTTSGRAAALPLCSVAAARSRKRLPRSVCVSVQPHVQPDTGTARGGPDLDQVAELVHHPQPQAPGAAERRRMKACQRVSDVTGIADLADQLPTGSPHREHAPAPGVAVGVGDDLAHRDDQIPDALWGDSGAAGVLGRKRTGRRQVVLVGQRSSVAGNRLERLVVACREHQPGVISSAEPAGSVPNQRRTGQFRGRRYVS